MDDNDIIPAASGGLSEHLLGNNDNNDNNNVSGVTPRPSWVDEEAAPLSAAGAATGAAADPSNVMVESGEAQPRRFRDAWAALLFLVKQGFILYLAFAWGWPNLKISSSATTEGDDAESTVSYGATFSLLFSVGLSSLGLGSLLLVLLTRLAEPLLHASLALTVAAQVALAAYLGIGLGYWVAAVLPAVLALATALYARAVWPRIPLAAAQLRTALQALQQNASVLLVAVFMSLSLLLWMAVWMLAFCGIYVKSTTSTTTTDDSASSSSHKMNAGIVLLLLLSLFWTTQVSKNIVHVTVSGTVGTWWFCPDDANRLSAVTDSWRRSLTYSLGSICVGSLLTAVMHVLHLVAHQARRSQTSTTTTTAASMLLCVVECITRCTERLLTYFNKW